MINTIVNEKGLTFKDFEIKIFQEACRVCREYTKTFLESYDRKLMQERDKKAYRNKGGRKTSVKTLFGEVEYSRNVYETTGEDGLKKFVFLLDEMFSINNVGLISQNMAEQLVAGITELSYRSCAEKVSAMTGQCISAMGVWNVIQTLGQQVSKDEQQLVCAHKQGQVRGSKEAPVLFEETDGVHVSLQGEDRRHRRKSEIKVGIAYDGWKETGSKRYELDGKVVVAGFSSNKDFQEYREAAIAETYNLDETQVRVLNGDGAPWIKNVKDKDTHFQLDSFHRNKAIKELVPYKDVRQKIHGYLKAKKVNDLLAYLEMYRDSLPDDEEASQAEKLLKYFTGNKVGLLPYQEQGIELPKNPDGLVYKNMGTMENHIWSVIAKRMKHNHTNWSISGGNNMAKILAKKCSGRLNEVTEKLHYNIFETDKIVEIQKEILSAKQATKTLGKGYNYPVSGHFIALDGALRGESKKLFGLAGY